MACKGITPKMDDIDEMFSDLLGEIDLLTQSLGVETTPPEGLSSSQNDLSFSVGFTDLNESLNELEEQDLDALMADLAAGLNVTEQNLTTERRVPSQPRLDLAGLPPPPQDFTLSVLSGHQNTTSAPSVSPYLPPSHPPPSQRPMTGLPKETKDQAKEDKIKLALEKLKQAKIKKMVIKVLLNDGSSKTLMVDESQTVRDILDSLFEKTHCDRGVDWTLCETNSELQIERGVEDHEHVVDILSAWTRDSENKILFLEKKDKYAIFKNPQNYYLWKKDKKFLKEMKEKEKEHILEENFSRGSIIVPDLEGILYLKEDGKRSWKQKYFLLRASGIYFVPKGKTKTSSDLVCFIQFENVNVYYATGAEYKNKHKVPTEFCFILKHPQIQKDSQYIKHLCCDDEWTLNLWVTGIRIAKYGEKMYENYKTAARKACTNSAWTNRNVSTPSAPSPTLKANGSVPQASHQPKQQPTVFPEAKAEVSFPPPPPEADRIQSPALPDLSVAPPPPPPLLSANLPPKPLPALPKHQLAAPPSPVLEDLPPPPPDFFPEPPPDFLPPPPPVHRLSPSPGRREESITCVGVRGISGTKVASANRLVNIPAVMTSSTLLSHNYRYLNTTKNTCCFRKFHSDAKAKDPFSLAQKDLYNLYDDIKREMLVSKKELQSLCEYYFDGKGKAIRPMIVVLMARACNLHSNHDGELLPGQRTIAMISEMIHTASLVHDDVIDGSDKRRGKNTINDIWGDKKAILAGDFILSVATTALARIGNTTVVSVLSQVIEDLVRGEFMQLGSKENENERFKHYLEKTFKKTASLIANSCKAVSILVNPDPEVHEICFQYGRNVGIAFQLVDDVLDFTSCANQLGKPSAADLRLGLATGPVLFACQKFPELHSMIMRRFSVSGDVEQAWQYVMESDGIEQTNYLAHRYCQEAVRQISKLRPSAERQALIRLTELVLSRDK
ncbi:hypothetical protein GJAV_G00091290 [Gymnothorax javanicus]|nr:hypothetical protein GJAV_G00091290 [Gymnothorax javanicus]